jgi:uncharacterized protein (TIGR00304 family)
MFDLVTTGLLLVLVGFVVVAISMVNGSRGGEGKVQGGGVVMVGPIPIIFGSDAKWASVAIVLAIALILLTLIVGVL